MDTAIEKPPRCPCERPPFVSERKPAAREGSALAVATELEELDVAAAIEVRSVLEQELGVLEDVFRDQWGRVLATLVGVLGDIELAEDAAQSSQQRSPTSTSSIHAAGSRDNGTRRKSRYRLMAS
jgi:hypothetical protein